VAVLEHELILLGWSAGARLPAPFIDSTHDDGVEPVNSSVNPAEAVWNEMADAYQVGDPIAFGGETIVTLGD
jgi:hypothetical protein